jgi:hypothetical protein
MLACPLPTPPNPNPTPTTQLDACTIKDSTLTGCGGPGYLGLATQDAEVCSTQGTCRLPLGLATDAAMAALAAPEADDAGDRRRRHQRMLQQQPAVDARVGLGVIQVLRADVMATCKAKGQCKDARELQNAMGEYLNLGAGAKLSVSVDQLDPLIARNLGMDPEAEAEAAWADMGSGDDGCGAVVQYNVRALGWGVGKGRGECMCPRTRTYLPTHTHRSDHCPPQPHTHTLQLYCVTKDPTLAAQFKAAMLEFNKAPTNEAFTAALRTAPAFAGLCTMAGLVSFDFAVPLADAAANLGA